MSDDAPAPCPACDVVVDATVVLDQEECPECGTGLRELFRLGRDRGEVSDA